MIDNRNLRVKTIEHGTLTGSARNTFTSVALSYAHVKVVGCPGIHMIPQGLLENHIRAMRLPDSADRTKVQSLLQQASNVPSTMKVAANMIPRSNPFWAVFHFSEYLRDILRFGCRGADVRGGRETVE